MPEEQRLRLSKYMSGRKLSEEHCKNISEGLKGHPTSEETKRKISQTQVGRVQSEQQKKKATKALRQFWKSPEAEETRKQMSESSKGQKHSNVTKTKISRANKGNKHTEETKQKMSERRKGKATGAKHPAWMGEDHNRTYPEAFFRVRKQILKRDGGKCLNPGCWGTSSRISVHHIDYDKNNNNPENLITVCMSCNNRANKGREFWIAYYRKLMIAKLKPVLNEGAL